LRQKLEELKADPFEAQTSKPLKAGTLGDRQESGIFESFFQVNGLDIIVAAIGPRGQIYKH
jgi:hypothetical protein